MKAVRLGPTATEVSAEMRYNRTFLDTAIATE
jgi:hypothetical protein